MAEMKQNESNSILIFRKANGTQVHIIIKAFQRMGIHPTWSFMRDSEPPMTGMVMKHQ